MDFKSEIDKTCAFHIDTPLCVDTTVFEQIKKTNGITEENPDKTVEILKEKHNCDNEICLLEKHNVTIDDKNFKPRGPRLSTEWLSNFEIDDVLQQIAIKYADRKFYHIPYQMIDFEKTQSELAKLDWPALHGQYNTFGTVINTDRSTGTGMHWFAVFGDFSPELKEYTIEYFNSSGELPPDEIIHWAKKCQYQWKLDKPIRFVIVTRIVNQKDNHSCGPYSLYYIISRLSGIPYSYFKNNKIGDENMHEFRKFLFRD